MDLLQQTNEVANVINEGLGTSDIKEYRARVREAVKITNIGFDKLSFENNGNVTASRTLFYRNGNSSSSITKKMVAAFEKLDIKITILETADNWKKFPTTSYFIIRFKCKLKKLKVKK